MAADLPPWEDICEDELVIVCEKVETEEMEKNTVPEEIEKDTAPSQSGEYWDSERYFESIRHMNTTQAYWDDMERTYWDTESENPQGSSEVDYPDNELQQVYTPHPPSPQCEKDFFVDHPEYVTDEELNQVYDQYLRMYETEVALENASTQATGSRVYSSDTSETHKIKLQEKPSSALYKRRKTPRRSDRIKSRKRKISL